MKKTLIALAALSGLAMGDEPTLTFLGTINLSSGVLTEGTPQSSVTVSGSDFQSLFDVTLSANSGNLTSGSVEAVSGYSFLSETVTGQLNGNVATPGGFIYDIANTQTTWVGMADKGNGKALTLTISGLEANALYNVSLLAGVNFEGAGAWNAMNTDNTYESNIVTNLGSGVVPVKTMGGWALTGVTADAEGHITFTTSATNAAHTLSFNGVSVAKVTTTPEPATATLSLLALAGLAARRRRH